MCLGGSGEGTEQPGGLDPLPGPVPWRLQVADTVGTPWGGRLVPTGQSPVATLWGPLFQGSCGLSVVDVQGFMQDIEPSVDGLRVAEEAGLWVRGMPARALTLGGQRCGWWRRQVSRCAPVSPAHGTPCAVCSCHPSPWGWALGRGIEFRKPDPQPQDHDPGLAGGGHGYLPRELRMTQEGVFPVAGGLLGLVGSEGLMLAYL